MQHLTLFKAGLCVLAMAVSASVAAKAAENLVTQTNKTFIMNGNKVEAMDIRVGDSIRFQNQDPFFHNIFSLSELKSFDLGSFPKGQSKTVKFDKAGVVEIECAIHPEMFMEVTIR
jgi:plastocyanin